MSTCGILPVLSETATRGDGRWTRPLVKAQLCALARGPITIAAEGIDFMGTAPKRPLLYDCFDRQAATLLDRYVGSKQRTSTTNMGDNREEYLRDYLTSVLPPRLTLRRGEVWDGEGNRTGQLEIIILRDDAAALGIGQADAFLAEGVFAVIEVKSNLTTEKLNEALSSLKKVRLLRLSRPSSRHIDSILTLFRPLCCVFA